MATPQALGAQLYNPLIPPSTQAALIKNQQQQAMAQALMTQGMTPLDPNRTIAGTAYRISPWEGVAKLAQALEGNLSQQKADDDLQNIYSTIPQQSSSSSASELLPQSLRDQYTRWSLPESMGGNPRAAEAMLEKFGQGVQTNEMRNASDPTIGPSVRGALANQALTPGQSAMQTVAAQSQAGNMTPAQAQALTGGGQAMPSPPPAAAGQAMPPQAQGQVDPSADPAAQYRAANGMDTPPIDAQRANMGLPIGSAAMGAPSVNASSLQPAAPPGNALVVAEVRPQAPNETNAQYKAYIDTVQKAQSAQAEATGKNLAEAQKGAASIDSRISNAQDMINEMLYGRDAKGNVISNGDTTNGLASKATSDGLLSASTKERIHNARNDQTSADNAKFQQLNSNLFTQELPGIVQSSGGRIDIPLVNAIKEASAIPMEDSPVAKVAALKGLQDILSKVQQNAHNQVSNMGGAPVASTPSSSGFTYLGVRNGNP